jgi:hypothetical protein
MKNLAFTVALAFASIASPAIAATTNIDLSGATTGTIIGAPGASFSETFAGQTVVGGNGISGSPTGPLTLAPAGTIDVAFFSPGVSPDSNSLLPEPGNEGPLSVLFDTLANSFTFTMGSSDAGSTIDVRAFDAFGALTGSTTLTMGSGYNVYTLNGLGTYLGLTFLNNNDGAGVRFQNMSYNSVAGGVPEPATWAMMLVGFGAIGASMRHRRRSKKALLA